jgi:chromosome segregation ATPase
LCKDLNEESANRNEEVIALREDLESVKTERDAMAKELFRLRAQVQSQENQRAEYAETKKKLREYESRGLDRADDEIQSRDQTISDLSFKLEQSLDLLELERAQPQQRRQIIFPRRTSLPTSFSSLKLEKCLY